MESNDYITDLQKQLELCRNQNVFLKNLLSEIMYICNEDAIWNKIPDEAIRWHKEYRREEQKQKKLKKLKQQQRMQDLRDKIFTLEVELHNLETEGMDLGNYVALCPMDND